MAVAFLCASQTLLDHRGQLQTVPSEQTELLESVQRRAVRGQEKLCPEKRLKAIRSSGPERRDCT